MSPFFSCEHCKQCSFVQNAYLRKDDTHHAFRSVTKSCEWSRKLFFLCGRFSHSSKRLQKEGGWVPLLLVVRFLLSPPPTLLFSFGESTLIHLRGMPLLHLLFSFGECTLIHLIEYAWHATFTYACSFVLTPESGRRDLPICKSKKC